jgi:hypothetical protein
MADARCFVKKHANVAAVARELAACLTSGLLPVGAGSHTGRDRAYIKPLGH